MIKKEAASFVDLFLSRKFLLFVFFGAVTTLVDWGLFALSFYFLHWSYVYGIMLSFVGGAATSFSLNKYVNFKNTYKKTHYQFALFVTIALVGFFITWGLMYLFIEQLGIHPMLSRMISATLLLAYNYICHTYLTFGLLK